MNKAKWKVFNADGNPITYCMFCATKVGDIHKDAGRKIIAMYYCNHCGMNYCDHCSYEEKKKRLCLRCDSELEQLL